jgi:DNA-binding transcriptional LysR family regulator
VWHTTRISPDELQAMKEAHPGLRIVPRTAAGYVDGLRAAGADGAVVSLGTEPDAIVAAMECFEPS